MARTIAIQYGIFTGRRVGKTMRAALRDAGYRVVYNPADADIIMAHSAGCFTIPNQTDQLLLLIDPPYWPGKSLGERARARLHSYWRHRHQFTAVEWSTRAWWGIVYALTDHHRNKQIMQRAPHYNLASTLQNQSVVIIRNEADDWLSPDVTLLIKQFPHVQLVEIPGDHDDCWMHPTEYINALKLFGRS